jgi:glycosyltransferase involved in cell wall biosynthesis
LVKKERLRVVMVISQFYPVLGGAEVQAQRLAGALLKRGIDVSVLTRQARGLPSYERIEGIPVCRAIRTIPIPLLWGFVYMVSTFLYLYKRRNEYAIIHCHILQEFQSIISLLLKLLFGKKVVVKMSSSGVTSDIKLVHRKVYGRLFLLCARYVDAIIAVCKESSRELRAEGFPEDRLVEIPNGVDTNTFTHCRDCRGAREERKITFIGRLDGYKGVAYLLQGFKTVLSHIEQVRLVIVGTGPDETHLKYLTGELKLQGKVDFRGQQENIPAILSGTDVFVLPSLSEGMSNVLLEAMACGLPIVATAVGGNRDLIRDGYNGILIPPHDAMCVHDALLELLNNDQLAEKLGKAARKTVEDHYSMERIADDYVSLYNQLGTEETCSQKRVARNKR